MTHLPRSLFGVGLAVLALGWTFSAPGTLRATQPSAAARPNILFLFADDMRADAIAAHGNPHIRTPHIDALVHRGVSFRRAYVFGGDSGAVCVASRAMLMSGRTLFNVDTKALSGVTLLPELLGRHGYTTFGTGKWHNGESSWLRAFQRGRTVMFGGMSDHIKVPVRDLRADGTLSPQRIETTFSSELFADSTIDFLRTHDGATPFFAYVAFTAPHDPRQPPLAYREPYYRSLPPLPDNFLPQFPFDNGMMRGGRDENLGAWPRTEAMVRDQLAEYYGLVTHMDEQIGRVLAALEASGHAENTLVVFAADNGLALGSHGLLGKQSVFEHSMRVPMVVAGPGVPSGHSTDAFAYLHDLFPTLGEMAGVTLPDGLDGTSLRPVWDGRTPHVRESVFLSFIQTQRAVRDERWKLIAYPEASHLQLFDLEADPSEKTNLVSRPEHATDLRRLQALMATWQQRVGDTVPIPTISRDPPLVTLTGQARTPDQWQPEWIVRKYFDQASGAR